MVMSEINHATSNKRACDMVLKAATVSYETRQTDREAQLRPRVGWLLKITRGGGTLSLTCNPVMTLRRHLPAMIH
jgi:hypothetical protein